MDAELKKAISVDDVEGVSLSLFGNRPDASGMGGAFSLALCAGSLRVARLLLEHMRAEDLASGLVLGMAARFGRVELLREALRRGADPNGATVCPLESAVSGRQMECASILVEAGAGVCAGEGTLLYPAVMNGDVDMVSWLLQQGAGNDVDLFPVVKLALAISNIEIAEILIRAGAHLSMEDLLESLGDAGCVASLRYLADQHGADLRVVAGPVGDDPEEILSRAVACTGSRERSCLLAMLVGHGAAPCLSAAKTPEALMFLIRHGIVDAAQALKKATSAEMKHAALSAI